MYTNCPVCGAKVKKENYRLLICTKCHFRLYLDATPTASGLLVNNKNEILLVKRAIAPKKGWWDLPGGFIDINETAEQALARELKEELNFEISKSKYIGSYPGRYLYQGMNKHILNFLYLVEVGVYKKFQPADDVAEFKFFAYNKLPVKKFAFPWMDKALKDFNQ